MMLVHHCSDNSVIIAHHDEKLRLNIEIAQQWINILFCRGKDLKYKGKENVYVTHTMIELSSFYL